MPELILGITGDCNLDCGFCFEDRDGELTQEQIQQYVSAFIGDHVEIGGGEPFLRKDLVHIVKQIIAQGKTVQIATNGTIMREDFMRLDEGTRSKVSLQVSLHAGTPETYREITSYDMFDQVVENLRGFVLSYVTGLSCAMYAENIGELPEILSISYELGLPIRVGLVFPNDRFKGRLLTPEQVRELGEQLLVEKTVSEGLVESSLLRPNICPVLSGVYGLEKKGACPAENGHKLYVDPSGMEHRCEFLVS